ncbi:MAG: methylmalonyl-CoA mutase small subunit [Alphaproteobacteria bacterium]|nr:methylmalonyl-CoA mutase small subunit [Alphaproteobacteria bacterium]MBF0128895.1 methylmalonyl-CoA mutase small subunit [Alphaproteobacteria bacterium]
MTEENLVFAGDFSATTRDQWVSVVEKALKGAPFDKKLVSKLYEGISIQPLYTRADWPSEGDPSGFPGSMPFTRGGRADGAGVGGDGWDIRQEHAHPDLKACNAAILADLQRGATSVTIRLDRAARAGVDGEAASAEALAGVDGVMVYSTADFDALLDKVMPEMVPLSIEAGAQFVPAAAALAALWRKRDVADKAAQGAFNADPLGVLAETGALPTSVDAALAQMADLAAHTSKTYPGVTAVAVNTSAYYDAGATDAQDLACSMATGVAYLRAMTAAGMDVAKAARQIVFVYSVGCDFFVTMAKLRAARKMWARIVESCGGAESDRSMTIVARTADRMMTRRDPWVNMLRTTVSAFAAGVAGANSVTVLPFDHALGLPDDFSRRIARNSQVVLKEEANLCRVVDPAGGSWYIESLTDQLARVAWTTFQEIEKAGGMAKALENGSIASQIAAVHGEREKNIGKRRDPLTGISEFPNIQEKAVTPPKPDLKALRAGIAAGGRGSAAALKSAPKGGLTAAAIDAAAGGASIGAMAEALKGPGASVKALPKHRLSETFEALRDAADAFKAKTGKWPAMFLANMGPVAQHTGRATFSKNFFEAGGIETLGNNGFADAESCAKAFKESGARMAIVCSSDALYEEFVPKVASALKAAGCEFLFLAGAPGEKKQAYLDAGVNDFIFLGCDVLGTLRAALARLGVTN